MVEQIDAAILAHKSWKEKLSEAVQSGRTEANPADIAKDNQCYFGKWLYGDEITQADRDSDNYRKVQMWHALFHKEASHVMELVMRQELEEAKLAMREEGQRYYQVSAVLLQLLEDWKQKLSPAGMN